MRNVLPEVLTVELPEDPSLFRGTLQALPQLHKLVVTEEDRGRAAQYVAKRQREKVRSSTPSLDEYLHSLDVVVTIAEADESTLPRVHQLFQRTNQFNLTTRRYPEGQLADSTRDPARRLYTLRAADRFGDHGLVATALVRAATGEWTVDSFLMSCRVIGLGVETALLSAICADARAAGAGMIIGEYIETAKNRPASDFYSRHGFSSSENADDIARWRRSLADDGPATPAWIRTERAS
jgi:FkbH-like protein